MPKGKSYRSAISGRYVTKSTAKSHPKTTVGETRKEARCTKKGK
jgi:hypothetical protein